jgi:hypothetical protein
MNSPDNLNKVKELNIALMEAIKLLIKQYPKIK